jgi:hypothetical protein
MALLDAFRDKEAEPVVLEEVVEAPAELPIVPSKAEIADGFFHNLKLEEITEKPYRLLLQAKLVEALEAYNKAS